MNIKHSMGTPEWYTPVEIIEAARATLGTIDLDPCSTPEANEVVKAREFYTKEQDGLTRDWGTGAILVNPPGGWVDPEDRKQGTLTAGFWRKAYKSYLLGAEVVWIGYSIEQLQSLQLVPYHPSPMDFEVCVPKRRLHFRPGSGQKATSPSHANFVCLMARFSSTSNRFHRAFAPLGAILGA